MHVLIATDGSALSLEAARRGLAMIATPERVTVISVITEVPGDDAGGFEGSVLSAKEQDALWQEEQADARAAVDALAAQVPPTATVVSRVEVGDPATAICALAGKEGADLVIVGSHGRGFLGRVVLGSVSEHVVRHCEAPVLVVRHRPGD